MRSIRGSRNSGPKRRQQRFWFFLNSLCSFNHWYRKSMILFCLIILGFVHRLQYFPKKHVKHACLIWWTLISITLFLAWICTRLLQYNFLHAYDVHLSSKHFYMIDPPPKNWFRFTDVAKHNKVSNISCKKSGRRIMVCNLEITAKKRRRWLELDYDWYTIQRPNESEQLEVGCTFEDTELIYVLD